MPEEKTEIEKAQELIEKDRHERERKCFSEVREILNKYNCNLVPVIQITAR